MGEEWLDQYVQATQHKQASGARPREPRKFTGKTIPYINVTVYNSHENKRVPAELPDDAPCSKNRCLGLGVKLQLPVIGENVQN